MLINWNGSDILAMLSSIYLLLDISLDSKYSLKIPSTLVNFSDQGNLSYPAKLVKYTFKHSNPELFNTHFVSANKINDLARSPPPW